MADIIIVGGRRSSPQRNVRGIAIAVVLLAACVLVAHFIYERVVAYVAPAVAVPDRPLVMLEDPTADTGTRLGYDRSSLSYSGTIAVLRAGGQPGFLGAAHGRLLGGAVNDAARALDGNIAATVPSGGVLGGLFFNMRLRWRHRFIDDGIPGHQLLEMAGLLAGTRRTAGTAPDYEAYLRQQAVLDVGLAAPWSSNGPFRTMARSLSFATTLRGTSGDRLLVGRSFALPGATDGGDAVADQVLLSFVKADSVIPFASIGWPGLVGVVSGMNAEGIAVMVHPVRTSDVAVSRKAQPVTLLARDVLENAHSLEEAVSILEQNAPLGAAAFVVVDGTARSWAVVERSPTRFAVQKSPKVVTDILSGEAFAEDPENDRAARVMPAAMRGRRVEQLLRNQVAEPGDVVAILRDHRDVSGTPLPPGHRGAVYDLAAVHTAVFDASGMAVWIADGRSAGARFRAFDLRYELRGEGARPAPPTDLPADPELDEGAARQVSLARRALRRARREQARGSGRRAQELVQRALAYAPDLPETLKLAGDLARAARDTEAANNYFAKFLDGIPDDMGAEAEVRAILGR